ncbi:MAG: hypothetical protein IJ058_04165 [Lachnospiraceae bacterium]|nr:hypothetical protein [Lachnospiraceae bacterium]
MDFEHPKDTALEGNNAFAAFLKSLGMPSNFDEPGANMSRFLDAADGHLDKSDV